MTTSATGVRKVGVEEELLLVDPETGRLKAVAPQAVRANRHDEEVGKELFLQQIETSTEPCEHGDDLEAGVRAGRRAVGEAAHAAGARAVTMPAPVLLEDPDDGVDFTRDDRYQRIRGEYGEIARQAVVSAMHVHVDVVDDEEGVRALDGLRPWLPLLLAVAANSPYWQGRDTGHASWRSRVWSRWPTAGAGEPFGDVATYRAVSEQLVGWGGGLDGGMLYFDARLSEKYPTLEVRVADVCTDVDDAVLVALLSRALVDTVVTSPAPAPAWRADLLRAATWRAARFGLGDRLVHPLDQGLVGAREVLGVLVDHVRPALEATGDLDRVTGSIEQLLARGTGATRQRQVLERTGDLRAVVDDLARRTEESWA